MLLAVMQVFVGDRNIEKTEKASQQWHKKYEDLQNEFNEEEEKNKNKLSLGS